MAEVSKRLTNSRNRIARRGGLVLVHLGPEGGETQYQLLDGGSVTKGTVSKLVEAHMLEPNNDGLFEGSTQTYRVYP